MYRYRRHTQAGPDAQRGELLVGALVGLMVLLAFYLNQAPPPPPLPPPPPPPVVVVQPPYVVLLPSPDGSSGKIFVEGNKGGQALNTVGQGLALDGGSPPFVVPPAQLSRDFGAAMSARPPAPMQFILYLQSGSTRLTAEAEALVPQILEQVKTRPSPDVSVTGHSDTKGAPEANARLALQRATAIAALLKERGLVPASLVIDSHGDKNLLVPTPSNTDEARNRRVEVVIR